MRGSASGRDAGAGLQQHAAMTTWRGMCVCVLISFIHNLGLTIKPIKGPPQGVYACPHNGLPLVGLTPDVCVLHLSLSMTVVSPELQRHSSSWKRRSRAAGGGGSCCTAGDGGSSPGGDGASLSPRFGERCEYPLGNQAVLNDPHRYASFAFEHGPAGHETILHSLFVHVGHTRREPVDYTGTFPGLGDCWKRWWVADEASAYNRTIPIYSTVPAGPDGFIMPTYAAASTEHSRSHFRSMHQAARAETKGLLEEVEHTGPCLYAGDVPVTPILSLWRGTSRSIRLRYRYLLQVLDYL
eukprot:COSAG01_NODE_8211_length_2873_cov_10.081831_1_plen_297_part_00